jgi:hypothetical protein
MRGSLGSARELQRLTVRALCIGAAARRIPELFEKFSAEVSSCAGLVFSTVNAPVIERPAMWARKAAHTTTTNNRMNE